MTTLVMLMVFQPLKRWLSRITAACDGGLCDVKNRHHSTRAQLMAFKAAINYTYYGCFYPHYPVERGYTANFNKYE